MIYALDRSVGKVRAALDANNVDENTIVVFVNDNGGPPGSDNQPFNGSKGLTWEGGVRVPYLINMPGLQPGVYDAPVSTLDLLPTLYAAAGGSAASLETDGVDLRPYLSGTTTEQPHEKLFFRNGAQWGVRKGDWKLGNPGGSTGMVLFNVAADSGETTNLAAENPEIVAELIRDMTDWEAVVAKPKWGHSFVSPYDHFIYRTELLPNNINVFHSFGSGTVFRDAVDSTITAVFRADSYPNLILEFPVRQTGNYAFDISITRLSQQTFMLNELRFTGNFTGTANHFGTVRESQFIPGREPILFVRNLEGNNPKIRLEATSSGTSSRFRFNLDNELQLHSDLEITGDGTQDFYINGGISDFWHPRSVRKTGSSRVTLTGNNTFAGTLQVDGGEVNVSGVNAAIDGANAVVIGSAASVVLSSGKIATATFDNASGGSFQFRGGELNVVNYLGDLANEGGNYSPGASTALSTISGNYTQSPASKLTMEIAGTIPGVEYDQVFVVGGVALGGTLEVALLNGFVPNRGDVYILFDTFGGVTGAFANTILPPLPEGLSWRMDYGPLRVRLLIDPQGGGTVGGIPGDYNGDGTVDAADYLVWRNTYNSSTLLDADGDEDGTVDDDDYAIWQASFGSVAPPLGAGSGAERVPEPGARALVALAVLGSLAMVRWRNYPPAGYIAASSFTGARSSGWRLW
jgi:autotransporter-associated beta strand protein